MGSSGKHGQNIERDLYRALGLPLEPRNIFSAYSLVLEEICIYLYIKLSIYIHIYI